MDMQLGRCFVARPHYLSSTCNLRSVSPKPASVTSRQLLPTSGALLGVVHLINVKINK